MDDLTAFVSARLDEDEEFAREAMQRPWRCQDNFVEDLDGGEIARFNLKADARHAAGWEPARVLREVAAMRQVVLALYATGRPTTFTEQPSPTAGLARLALRNLAAVWSDHPDYQAAWTLDG